MSAARAAQSGRARGAPKGRDGAVEAIRTLMVAKRSARAERTQTINQARSLILTGPEDLRARFAGHAVAGLVAGIALLRPRPGDAAGYATRFALRELGRRAELVATAAEPSGPVIARLMTIPGIGQRIAQVIVAETGGDMARFTSSSRLAAWAGLAPGDNESAGKRKKAAARKGNPHLRAAMVEGAWAVSRTTSPARGPVPAPDLQVRQAQHQEGRGRRCPHPALHRLGRDEA